MDKKELQKFIKESLKKMNSEFENSLDSVENKGGIPMSDIDMPIQDKAIFSAMDNETVEDDMSDISRYRRDKVGDYEGGFQDDVSVSPGYFNESEDEVSSFNPDAISSENIFKAAKNPYGASMYFLTNYNNVLDEKEAIELADNIGDNEYVVKYDINWEDENMYTESGNIIPSAYGVKTDISIDELQEIIKKGVERVHKKTLIENRLEQINNELNMINNPEAWESARTEAKAQLAKKSIAWNNISTREGILSEISFKDIESMIPVEAPKDKATIKVDSKWVNMQKESVSDIMGRAADLMAEAKKKYNNISK